MAMLHIFSKRKARAEKQQPDVYVYDPIPRELRVQVIHLWAEAIGPWIDQHGYFQHSDGREQANDVWDLVNRNLAEELGQFTLGTSHKDPFAQCQEFLLTADTDHTLDLIELSFRAIDLLVRDYLKDNYGYRKSLKTSPDDAIAILNARFQEHCLGYQYTNGQIVRVDSTFIHAEVVKPALAVIQSKEYAGVLQEFLTAHEHYRHGRHKEAIAEAGKCFESMMKAICDNRGWSYPAKATAQTLIDTLIQNQLMPSYMQAVLLALPTIRNKSTSAHGQGATVVDVPPHLAAFALHLCASGLVLLDEAEKKTK